MPQLHIKSFWNSSVDSGMGFYFCCWSNYGTGVFRLEFSFISVDFWLLSQLNVFMSVQ